MAAINEDPDDPLGRDVGDPLPHPKIQPGDKAKALRHWEKTRRGASARDWRALWQCDPKAPEGVLLSWDMLRQRRCFEQRDAGACSTPVRVAVAVDPSGGGRDSAGVIGGYLGEDGRVHISHDLSGVMSSESWARAACELAADTSADAFIIETNFGADMGTLILRTAWNALRAEQPERFSIVSPRIIVVKAKVGKLLRAEPASQQWKENRVVTAQYLPEVESEWATWTPGSFSPGRIDASVYLILELLPTPESGAGDMTGAALLADTDLFGGMFDGTR
jgi:phage terminase large subunit-like protein